MAKIQVTQDGKILVTQNGGVLLGNESGTPTIESLSITPMTLSQTIVAPSEIDGYSPITVSAVTSSIDANIQAGNIKKDVQILGVTGTLESGITPSGTLSVTQNGTYDVTNYASANVNVSGSGSDSKYGATVETFLGDVDSNGELQSPTEQSDLVFTGVKSIEGTALYYKFAYSSAKSVSFPDLISIGWGSCENAFRESENLETASFPSLTTIYNAGCSNMFYYCTSLRTVELPNLTSLTGMSAMEDMFDACRSLTSISFPKLTNLTYGIVCKRMFYGCTALVNIYFNALTTSSFGSSTNQFTNMMSNTGKTTTHTIHFPSNMESTISTLSGYPLFGGTSGKVVCAFDLPATS